MTKLRRSLLMVVAILIAANVIWLVMSSQRLIPTAYVSQTRESFSGPPYGTDFDQKLWAALDQTGKWRAGTGEILAAREFVERFDSNPVSRIHLSQVARVTLGDDATFGRFLRTIDALAAIGECSYMLRQDERIDAGSPTIDVQRIVSTRRPDSLVACGP